jgi:hypothetical protein
MVNPSLYKVTYTLLELFYMNGSVNRDYLQKPIMIGQYCIANSYRSNFQILYSFLPILDGLLKKKIDERFGSVTELRNAIRTINLL